MDEKYLQDLYSWIGSKDNTYQKRYNFDQFKNKLKDESYAIELHKWISGVDNTFASRRPIDKFVELVGVKKKGQAISQGSVPGLEAFQQFKPGASGFLTSQKQEGQKPKEVKKKLSGTELGNALSTFKSPSFQELYNVDPTKYSQEVKRKQQEISINAGLDEDDDNFYYQGTAYPKTDFAKYNNIIVKRNVSDDPSQLNYWLAVPAEFNKAVSDFLVKSTAGGLKLLRDLPLINELSESIYQATGKDPLNFAVEKLNETADVYDYRAAKQGLSDESIPKAIIHAAPIIAMTFATGGGGAIGLAESSTAAASKSLLDIAKKSAMNPLVKTLATQQGLSSYGEARRGGASRGEALQSGLSGALEGVKSGITLTAQGALAGRVTKDFMNSIYAGNLAGSTAKNVSKVIGGLNTSLVFGATPIVNDLLQGKVPDLEKAAHEAMIGMAFEVPHVVGGVSGLVKDSYGKYKTDNSIFQTSINAIAAANGKEPSQLTPSDIAQLTRITLDNNAVNNFLTAKPEAIDIANNISEPHQKLFEMSLSAGEKAMESKDLPEKTALHIEQLTLQKASDIKYVTESILKNKESFIDAVDKMDISDAAKSEYKQRIEDVYEQYSEAGRINKQFDTAIESVTKEIEELTSKMNSETSPSKKASINASIQKKNQQLSELKNALDEFAFYENEKKEFAIAETKRRIEIDDFVDRVKSGEDISSPEDLAFYENNKKQIDKKLKDAIQEQTTSEVPFQPEARVGEEVAEGKPKAEPQATAEGVKKEVSKTASDIISELEAARGKKAKSKLIEDLKSVTMPDEFDAFIEANPKYKKYVSEAKETTEVSVDEVNTVFNSAKKKAMEAVSRYKQGLSEGVKSQKEKSKALKDIVDGLRQEISIQLKNAKSNVLSGGKISAVSAQRMLSRVNNAKTPLQILNAIDYVEKSLKDFEYGNKLDEAKRLSSSVKKLAKNAPLNIRIALESLASSSPVEIKDVDAFISEMSNAEGFLKQNEIDSINQKNILDLSSRIQKSNLKRRIDRATDILARKMVDEGAVQLIELERASELEGVTDKAAKKEINEKYDNQIDNLILSERSKIQKPISDSIAEMKEALGELNDTIVRLGEGVANVGEYGGKKRDSMEAINEVLRADLEIADISGLSEKKKMMVEAMRDIDISKLTDKQLKFLNYAIDNFTENGAFDGVGQYIYNQYKIQKSFTPDVIEALKSTALGLNKFKRAAFDRTSVDAFFGSSFANEKSVAIFRVASGFADWSTSYGSKNGFKGRLSKDMEQIHEIAKSSGVLESPKSQAKMAAIVDIVQHEKGLTKTQIQAEFEGRKEAMVESIRRGRETELKSEEWKMENGEQLNIAEEVYNEFIKDSNTPGELLSKLNDGEIKLLDAMREKFESIKEGQRELSEIHKNEPFNDVEFYFPRTYTPLAKAKTGEVEALDLVDSSGFRVRENLDKTKSTAFEDRVLKGSQVRKNHMVNYNIIDAFQNEYRKQLYDYYTYEHRQYASQAVSSKEMLESLNGDLDLLNYLQKSFGNRYLNEVRGLQAAKELGVGGEIWNLMKNSVVRDALGGVATPFLKQYAPTFASMWVNSPETSLSAIGTAYGKSTNKIFLEFIANSPVSLRHKQEVASTGGLVSANDLKEVAKGLRKSIKWLNGVSDKVLMTALKQGDVSSASLAYLAYYQKSLLQQGEIKSVSDFDIYKEAKSPNKVAQQYAEQMTSTTLNINEAVNKPVDATIPFIGASMPFTSFAMNSKIVMMNNIGKIFESKGVMSTKDKFTAIQRIGSAVAESAAINAVGYMMRAISYGGAYQLFSYALANSDMDDKLKAKAMDVMEYVFDGVIDSNEKNSWSYFVNDLLFGQIGENFTKPITSQLSTSVKNVYSSIKGEQKDAKSAFMSSRDIAGALLSTRGYGGMMVMKGMKQLDNISDMLTYYNDPLFRLNKFGYVNAYGDKVIPFEEQNTSVPAFNKYMQTISVLSNTVGLITGSPKELQDFTRRMPSINKKIITELYGKDRKVVSLSQRYNEMEPVEHEGKKYYIDDDELSVFKFADREYVLDENQLKERIQIKRQFLDGVYNKFMNNSIRGVEAKRKAIEKILESYPNSEMFKSELNELKYAGKASNQAIDKIADAVSMAKIVSKYYDKQNNKINIKLKSEVKSK